MTPEKFEEICDEIASCSDSNDEIIERHGESPRTFYRFIAKDENWQQYARAKQLHAEVRPSAFRKKLLKAKPEDAPLLRIELDEMKWENAHEASKKWGDKLDVTSAGDKIQSAPPIINVCSAQSADIVKRFVSQEVPVDEGSASPVA